MLRLLLPALEGIRRKALVSLSKVIVTIIVVSNLIFKDNLNNELKVIAWVLLLLLLMALFDGIG